MGAKKKAAAAGTGAVEAAKAAKDNPYLQRIVDDDELRENLQHAYESARDAYSRISSSKKPAKAVLEDKKLQRDLKSALDSIRDAGEALRDAPKRSKAPSGGGLFRKVLLAGLAAGLAL
ncbi:MAG: hypothetical protein JWO02_2418, partial [Solirubrobacterales bacterium]|nr:hypothetical protein [Solirubrobacterales bacterium]